MPLKPRIQKLLRHYPILFVWGTQGSDKSTMIMEVLWPMLGVVSTEPYSATETEFALLKLLSSTSSVPVFIDEYKPHDMPRHRRNTLHRYMRRLYTGEVEERGRADQTLVSYRLSAALCVAGETRPIEPALVERMLVANPEKNALPGDPRYEQAYRRIQQVNPTLISAGIVRFLLARDTEADFAVAQDLTERLLDGRSVPYRVRDNITVMMLGLHCFEEYATGLGITLPELEVDAASGSASTSASGARRRRRLEERQRPQAAALRHLHAQVHEREPRHGLQHAGRPARRRRDLS